MALRTESQAYWDDNHEKYSRFERRKVKRDTKQTSIDYRTRIPQDFPTSVKLQIKEAQDNRCAVLETEEPLQVHHIVPKFHGGRGNIENGVAVTHEVHVFLDHMALYRQTYFPEIMEMGKEYVVGYLNATDDIQRDIIFGQGLPNSAPSRHLEPGYGYDQAAGDD